MIVEEATGKPVKPANLAADIASMWPRTAQVYCFLCGAIWSNALVSVEQLSMRYSFFSDRQFKLIQHLPVCGLGLLLLWLPVCLAAPGAGDALKTRAELSNYEETSRYADVLAFLDQLQKSSSLVQLHKFGRTYQGRDLPLAVIAEPLIASPEEARRSGKATVLVFGNIHAGEVDGKEAAQEIARRL